MKNNNYALFYKTTEYSHWQSIRPNLPVEEWENYAKEQGYAKYDIKKLDDYNVFDLHLLTDVVLFNGKYYLPEETIPYHENTPEDIRKFNIKTELDEDYINDEDDFEEVYNNKTIDWGWGGLWTAVNTEFIMPNKTSESLIVAQNFIAEYPDFTKKLKEKGFAVLIIMEFSKIKWLAWLKEDRVRLIQQEYNCGGIETCFDVLLDKDWFFEMGKELTLIMQKFVDKDIVRYQDYVIEKYGKI